MFSDALQNITCAIKELHSIFNDTTVFVQLPVECSNPAII